MTSILLLFAVGCLLWVVYRTVALWWNQPPTLPGGEDRSRSAGEIAGLMDLSRRLQEAAGELVLERDTSKLSGEHWQAARTAFREQEAELKRRMEAVRSRLVYLDRIEQDLAELRSRLDAGKPADRPGLSILLGLLLLSWTTMSGSAYAQEETRNASHSLPVCPEQAEIRASQLITVLDLYESYLVVEQSWLLHTAEGCLRRPEEWGPGGIEFLLPESAQGFHLITPGPSQALVGERRVLFRGAVGPAGEDAARQMPTLAFQFSLPNESRVFDYLQTMPVAVERALVVVPQQTEHTRFPRLDVELEVPVCGQGADGVQYVCFSPPGSNPDPWEPLSWLSRRVARGGQGRAGARLAFQTRGWPIPPRQGRWIAALGLALVTLTGVGLAWRSGRWCRVGTVGAGSGVGALEERRQTLLHQLLEAEGTEREGRLGDPELETLLLLVDLDEVYHLLESGQGQAGSGVRLETSGKTRT